jgi:hypothetical protein
VFAGQREPGLMIARRRFDDEKHGGGDARQFVGGKVVELDEADAFAVRAHGQVETVGARGLKQGRDRATKIFGTDAGDVDRIEPVGILRLRQRTEPARISAASAAAAGCPRCWRA